MKYKMIFLGTMTMMALLLLFAMLDINASNNISDILSGSIHTLLNWVGETEHSIDEIGYLVRKLGHLGFYALLSAMIAIVFFKRFNKLWPAVIGSGSVTLILSFMDEFIQHFAIGRNASYFDILIDLAGAIIGLLIFASTIWAVKSETMSRRDS